MDILNKFIEGCKKAKLNGKGISDSNPEGAAKGLGATIEVTTAIVNIVKGLEKEHPKAFAVSPWDDATWNQFQKLISDRLPKKVETAGLFGSTEQPTQSPQAQVDTIPEDFQIDVISAARTIKSSDKEEYELFGLGDKDLNPLIKRVWSKYKPGMGFDKLVQEEMDHTIGCREWYKEAQRRGWTVAPKNKRGQTLIPTDPAKKIIGNAHAETVFQNIQYGKMPIEKALNAFERQAARMDGQATQTGLFGG